MAEQGTAQEQASFTIQMAEAGFSMNVKMIDPFGSEVMLTFRAPLASHADKLMDFYTTKIERLIAAGWTAIKVGAKLAATESAAQAGGTPTCPVHGSAMRQSNHGGHYCSKKLADGSYCKAKA